MLNKNITGVETLREKSIFIDQIIFVNYVVVSKRVYVSTKGDCERKSLLSLRNTASVLLVVLNRESKMQLIEKPCFSERVHDNNVISHRFRKAKYVKNFT